MASKKIWKFIKDNDLLPEKVLGRNHYWHYNPEITKGAGIIMVKVKMPVGGSHNFHRHPKMNEILYILEGEAEQWVENDMQILKAGDSVYIHHNMVHGTFNTGTKELVFLAILSPEEGWEAGTIDEYMNKPYSEYKK